MAVDNKFVVKHGLTTQNISFVNNISVPTSNIVATMLSSNTLSFSGTSGQLFSITDSMTGTIFAVNDISGVPSIEVLDDGTVRLAEIFGNVGIGTSTPIGKLHVAGNVWLANTSTAIGGIRFPDGTFQTTAAVPSPPALNATNASNVTITSTSTNTNFFPVFVEATSGNLGMRVNGTGFLYNPGTDTITLSGNILVQNGGRFGNISVSNTTPSSSTTTGALVVSGGMATGGNIYASGNLSLGLVNNTNRIGLVAGNNQTAIYAQSAAAAGDFLLFQDSNPVTRFRINSSGNILTGGWNGTTIEAQYGGTGFSSYTTGNILYADSSSTLAQLGITGTGVGSGNVLLNNGSVPTWGRITLSNQNSVTGTLAVGNGGTGSSTQFTQGSVVFAGASGVYSQDNTNLFWDDTNNRLGVRTATPQTILQVGARITDDFSFTYDDNSAYIVHQTPTGTTALNDPRTVLMLGRQGASGQAYGAAAEFRLSRYENSGVTSRTRLDVSLANGNFLAGRGNVMTMLSSGNVGIGSSLPGVALQVTAPVTAGTGAVLANFGTGSAANRISIVDETGAGSIPPTISSPSASFGLGLSAQLGPIIGYTAGSERIRIDTTGNVGIGTTTLGTNNRLRVEGVEARVLSRNSISGTETYFGSMNPNESRLWATTSTPLTFGTNNSERMRIDQNGNVSIGTSSTTFTLEVNGSFAATTKSFLIPHPTKPGKRLRYGSLEGPENGVYVRGRIKDSNRIALPEYWSKLVDPDSITVNLTPIGEHQDLYVESVGVSEIVIGKKLGWFTSSGIDAYFVVFAERCDVDRLQVEV